MRIPGLMEVEVMSTTRDAQSAPIRFEAELATIDDATLVRLPKAAREQLPSRGQIAVHATIDGHRFDTVVEPDGRRGHWLRVDRHLQQAAGIGPAETAEMTLEVAPHCAGARRPRRPGRSPGRGTREHPRHLGGDHPDGEVGMGPLGPGDGKPRHAAATGRGEHLEDGQWEEATVLLRHVLLHRTRPG